MTGIHYTCFIMKVNQTISIHTMVLSHSPTLYKCEGGGGEGCGFPLYPTSRLGSLLVEFEW